MSESSPDLQQELLSLLTKSDNLRAQVTELNSEIARIAGKIAKRDADPDGLVMGTLLDHTSATAEGTTAHGRENADTGTRETVDRERPDGPIAPRS